jgi:hypothetical protein
VKRISASLVMVVALAMGATTYGAVLRNGNHRPRSTGAWPGIMVSGSVSGLYPGTSTRLPLKVRNLLNRTVTIRWLNVQVGKPGGACPARALPGGRYPLRLGVPRRATRTISVSLRMAAGVSDVCSGARFPLTFQVTSKSTEEGREKIIKKKN